MIKQTKYNIEETNIANLGSDLEKEVKKASAAGEKAWVGAGKAPGLQIWRIEKFKVVAWPKEEYGKFFDGDSYIVLNTYKKPDSDKLHWDIHFWLGDNTTQDEAGTAAYKTVELDTLLGGEPVQHREVQDYESRLFLSYFKPGPQILHGGIESGFRHVKPTEYKPRLLHVKGKKKIRVREVPLSRDSLNSGDVFILDAGLKIFQLNGSKSGPGERAKAAQLSRALDDERGGKPQVIVVEEADRSEKEFWDLLGGYGPLKSAEDGGSDDEVSGDKKLFRLSDASGKLEFTEVQSGKISKSKLDTKDVFVFDAGHEVFVWIGLGATAEEKKAGLGYAQTYLKHNNRPSFTPISKILEGAENEVFISSFDH
jgi:gelsolin